MLTLSLRAETAYGEIRPRTGTKRPGISLDLSDDIASSLYKQLIGGASDATGMMIIEPISLPAALRCIGAARRACHHMLTPMCSWSSPAVPETDPAKPPTTVDDPFLVSVGDALVQCGLLLGHANVSLRRLRRLSQPQPAPPAYGPKQDTANSPISRSPAACFI